MSTELIVKIMAHRYKNTSLITILSSEHGRLRREQRDIDKRDLKKALKHGRYTRSWGRRWMVEHDGIVFITDNTMTQEVTAYPAPLSLAPVDSESRSLHEKAKILLDKKPEFAASHTVLIVDNSGSMLIHDINLHRDRQTAAYTMTALEFIAEQIFNGTANNSDVVSLIEFSGTARVVFTREPVSWVLYNKLLSRRDGQCFQTREVARNRDLATCDSNYLPAIEEAQGLLSIGDHDECALSLFFLTDGAPTDARNMGLTPVAAQKRMCIRMSEIASKYKDRLSVSLVGFGSEYADFSVLQSMVDAIKDSPGGARTEFFYCDKYANAIGDAVSSLVASTTASKTALLAGGKAALTDRRLTSEAEVNRYHDWYYHRILSHQVFDPKTKNFIPSPELPFGADRDASTEYLGSRRRSPPPYLAINKHFLGKGAERVAYRCQLADKKSSSKFVLGAMVAKETKSVEFLEDNIYFHRGFMETQSLASHLAQEFNKRLRALPEFSPTSTPRLVFLPCSVLVLEDPFWPGGSRGVLVEKQLDVSRFEWKKWNDNAGAVDGRLARAPLDVERELAKLALGPTSKPLLIIEEDSDEEEDEESISGEESGNSSIMPNAVRPADYLQAFTHFTYLYTNKKVMVCDLQGVFNTDLTPPTFELTDPVIHYSSKHRDLVFGRTDKGRIGMKLFFKTHQCTRVCGHMKLSKKNPQWRKQWHGL